MREMDPRIDLVFKKIFGVEENKDLLISLINAIVSEKDQVVDLTLVNPYNLQSFQTDKLSILDIKAASQDGKRFNIEIQVTDEADYEKRALYYWAKLYTEQLKEGDDYDTLAKAIGIHILNFNSIPNVKKYHNVFHIHEKDGGRIYFRDLELHTIELEKFHLERDANLQEMLARVKSARDMWVAFLTRHELLTQGNLPPPLDAPVLKKALHVLEVMKLNPQEREAYESREKWRMIEANTIKKYRQEGEKAGLEKGKKQEKLAIARSLKTKGLDTDMIASATGLTPQEIKDL